jgi:hypothetical protein
MCFTLSPCIDVWVKKRNVSSTAGTVSYIAVDKLCLVRNKVKCQLDATT